MSTTLRLILLCELACRIVVASQAQSDVRNNFCARRDEIANGTRAHSQALGGMTLHVAICLFDDHFIRYDNQTHKYTGYLVEVMAAIAEAGNFEVAYYNVPIKTGQTFTSWLFEVVTIYDITGIYFSETVDRVKNGTVCPYPFLDTSLMLYAQVGSRSQSLFDHIFEFARPFYDSVWILFLTFAVATGIVYAFFEHGVNEQDNMNTGLFRKSLGNAIYLGLFQMTQGGGYSPRTKAGKILAVSWAWTVFLFISAYTGSIASMLYAKTQNRFANLDAFLSDGNKLCTWGAGADFIRKKYPHYGGLVTSLENPIKDLAAGKCEAALVERMFVDMARDNKELNPKCLFQSIGHPVAPASGGWMMGTSYDKCDFVFRQSLELLFLQLKAEGKLEEMYTALVAKSSTMQPSCESKKNNVNADEKLSLHQMSGIFYIHGFLSTIAVSLFFIFLLKRKAKRYIKGKHSESVEEVAEGRKTDPSKTPVDGPLSSHAGPDKSESVSDTVDLGHVEVMPKITAAPRWDI